MLQVASGTATKSAFFRPDPAPRIPPSGSPTWTRPHAAEQCADGVVRPRLSRDDMHRALLPLSSSEGRQAARLAPRLMPTQWAPRSFDATVPSEAVGPSSRTRYSFTCCPMDRASPHGRKFTVDDFMDQVFKTGARTTISLTNQGDSRHSEYYKQTRTGDRYSIASRGQPAFTTSVREADGRQVTASIFKNTVQHLRTGETRHVNMVHINGWADQTALGADTQMRLISQLKDHLSNDDLRSVAVHCSEGRNRTGSFTSMMEGMDAVAKGQPPEMASRLKWFRHARVPDAVFVPEQIDELAKSEVRLNRLATPARRPAFH
jgi:hypothetical protein